MRKSNLFFILLYICAGAVVCLLFSGCPNTIAGTENPPSSATFTFEEDTQAVSWVLDGHIYPTVENGAVNGALEIDTGIGVDDSHRSLLVSADLGAGTYTSCSANFKLLETLGWSASDFSKKKITIEVFVPDNGSNYIQFVLTNANGSRVMSQGYALTYNAWKKVVFDIPDYILLNQAWGYTNFAGGDDSEADVYTAVTRIAVKVGFSTSPGSGSYEFNVDNLDIINSALTLSLRAIALQKGIIIGAEVNHGNLADAVLSSTLKTEFNCLVAGNDMKFSYLEPVENTFTYANADQLTTFAASNNMRVRGHVLIWHSNYQIPQWVKDKDFGDLQAVVENHVENVMAHYQNKIYAWDVANEIVLDDGSGLRNRTLTGGNYSVWASNATDDSLFKAAFYKAAAVRTLYSDPVKLYLCDYNNEQAGQAKADKFYNIVAGWVGAGVPIDGVAFQLHAMEKYTPNYTKIRENIDRFQVLGLDVQFTEVDVRIEDPVTQAKLDNQALIYGELMKILREKNLDSYIIWGVSDKYSWIPAAFPGYGTALLFDESFAPKPAYYALRAALLQ
jgi:endo-1,4-beta-xylanase